MKELECGGRRGQLRRCERYTLTLVVVVIVFVVCELPDLCPTSSLTPQRERLITRCILQKQTADRLPDLCLRSWMLLHRISPERVSFPLETLRAVNIVSNLCLTINSSVNFIIYCFVGRRFRDLVVRLICSNASRRSSLQRRSRSRQLRCPCHADARSMMMMSSGRVMAVVADCRIVEHTADNSQ